MLNDIVSRFLLVSIGIETILQETTIYRRRQRLRGMESGLGLRDAYEAMVERIKAEGGERARLGMAVLMWISHSRRPLKVDELCHAIAIRIGSNDFYNDDTPSAPTLLSCCQGLVTIEKGTSTVRLIHFTLQEHLSTHPKLFERAHATMAETCLTYLNLQHVNNLPASPSPDPRATPFLEYSSLYWGTHMRMELSHLAKTFALKLLYQFNSHISAEFLWDSISGNLPSEEFPRDSAPNIKGFSVLHCVSYFGIADVANTLIMMNIWDVNQRDGAGMTPLIWAARSGHEEVVKLLLGESLIQPDQQDTNCGRTALSWAAENGHEGVVRLFLGSEFVDPASTGRRWGKAWQAAGLLFGWRYVNPNSPSASGRTPLSWAAEKGHGGILKLLLEREDVNPDTPDTEYGRTPLSWAAEKGHEEVVKLLLERKDVNPNTPDTKYGQTPLSWAAVNGHEGAVNLLLEREDVNPDTPDTKYGRTPLSWAARNSREGIVKLLLGRGDVNPNTPDTFYSQTPLSLAAQKGHEGVVKLLLGREDVNPDTPDRFYGRTPLSWAAKNGYEGIVKLLLGREDVSPDTPDTMYGQTPLSWAAENGHEEVVKLLLERKDVNPNTPDTEYGRTPLSWAARNSHEGIVKLLLGREDANPDVPDTEYGQTPLSWAAENGCEGVVKLLLGRKDVNRYHTNKLGQIPLTLAANSGHDSVVKLLQSHHSRRVR